MTSKKFREPLVPLLLLLSATTGMIDAVSVLGLGRVFTANMTGNVVFLGFAIAGVPGFSWPIYVVALLFFALGAGAAGKLGRTFEGKSRKFWLRLVAAVEAGLLWAAALVALAVHVDASVTSAALLAMVALTASAMGVRNATVRALKVPDLTTTVLTLTITGLAADARLAGGSGPNLARRMGAVAAILVGAAFGAWLLTRAGLALPLAIAGAAVMLATCWLAEESGAAQPPPAHGANDCLESETTAAGPSSSGETRGGEVDGSTSAHEPSHSRSE